MHGVLWAGTHCWGKMVEATSKSPTYLGAGRNTETQGPGSPFHTKHRSRTTAHKAIHQQSVAGEQQTTDKLLRLLPVDRARAQL